MLTNSMEPSTFWEADSSSANVSQEPTTSACIEMGEECGTNEEEAGCVESYGDETWRKTYTWKRET
jgi:hypothetical protein